MNSLCHPMNCLCQMIRSLKASRTQPLAAAILLMTMTFIPSAHPQRAAAGQAKDQAAVLDTMQTLFAAAATDDLAKFHSAVAPSFYAYDGGKRFEGDALMELIKTLHASGKIYVWKITEPEIHIDGNLAWITYVNRGSVEDASGKKDLSWLESAVLEKQGGAWRIRFLHSTRVPQP